MHTQVGAGYWLTDEALLRSKAEQLAKDQFAARRDPADAALQYMALGRRSLLQVIGPCTHVSDAPMQRRLCRSGVQTNLAAEGCTDMSAGYGLDSHQKEFCQCIWVGRTVYCTPP